MDVRSQPNSTSTRSAESPATHTRHRTGGLQRLLMILTIVLVICALVFTGWRAYSFFAGDSTIKSGEYQALFLTNGQVYFGHLSHLNSGYVKLSDIYYLQVQQTVQPGQSTSSSQSQKVSLTKLGNELHGPEDAMYVAKNQVLFWENLKNNGNVVTAITNYQNKNK